MAVTTAAGLASLNAAPAARAEGQLRAVCASKAWASATADGRPYAAPDDLYAAADTALATFSEADLDEALSAHPRIGERAEGASSREQGVVAGSGQQTLQALADGNAAYEARFGHVYLVCASGRSGDELLEVLGERLGNDPSTERKVVLAELGRINRLRLERLVQGGS